MIASGIFSDLVVIELASVLAGPSVGMFFAELGARVIKVENFNLGGDVTRTWKLSGEDSMTTVSAYFSSVNWGKESIGINLANSSGKELVYALIQKADLVITSYKPGDAEKLGMGAERLCALNPKLIYAAITAYGADASRTGFDAIIQAESGFMSMNGSPESGPLKMPVALMDVLAAHQLKEAILVALIERMKSGKGTVVSASLIDSALASLVNQAANYLVAGKIPGRMGSGHPNIVPYGSTYVTSDQRHLVLAVGNDKQFQLLCDCIGSPELKSNPAFANNPSRVKNREELEKILLESIAKLALEPLLSDLEKNKVPAGAVLNLQEVFENQHAKEMLLEYPGMKGVKSIAFDNEKKWQQTPVPPPEMCAHTKEVLKNYLGLTDEQIKNLILEGVIA